MDAAAELLRRHLTSEIARRRAGNGRVSRSVTLVCSICGCAFTRAKPRPNPICGSFRKHASTTFAPNPEHIAWVELIPDERLDELGGALALLAS